MYLCSSIKRHAYVVINLPLIHIQFFKTLGFYRFVISGYDTSELWISTNDDPYNVLLYSYIRQVSTLKAKQTKLSLDIIDHK